jgi:hypothetical protein
MYFKQYNNRRDAEAQRKCINRITMPQVLDQAALDTLTRRIHKLSDGSAPKWGEMTVNEMLTHCSTAIQMGLGDIAVKVKFGKAMAALARLLFIDVFPFPKGSPTAPELHPRKKLRKPEEFARERDQLIAQLKRLHDTPNTYSFADHPLFRQMDRKRWGQLVYRHIDHHLRQFGV